MPFIYANMPFICLPLDQAKEFRKALKDKELDLAKLLTMTTEERTALLQKYVGDQAKTVNTLFEEKLVLKNRMQGLKNWASKVGEIGRYEPTKKAELDRLMSEYRAKQQERIFSPQENQTFLADLAEKKLGTAISREEAKNIFDLSTKAEEAKKSYDATTETWKDPKAKAEYGATKVIMDKYLGDLKDGALSVKDMLKSRFSEFKQQFAQNPVKSVLSLIYSAVKTITENSISLVATLDNSFIGRQGLTTLFTHPTEWAPVARQSFIDMFKTMKGEQPMDALMADIYSRPNYLNGNYQKAGLISGKEEQYPTTIPERIPGVGRVLKASDIGFTGSAIRMRANVFDLLYDIAKKDGVKIDETQIKDLGKLVGSATAKAKVGPITGSPLVKLALWAPRMLKANWDVLTAHTGGAGLETAFARKQAATNLLKVVAETALVMAIFKALDSNSVELDPRSSDFGKIKFGNTRFDITGGKAAIVTLASRLLSNSSKSTTTKAVTPFGTGYGQQTRFDALLDFFVNKTTPPVHAIIDLAKGKNAIGQKVTPQSIVYGAFTPISLQNVIQLKDDQSADRVLGILADGVGISANTYTISQTDWTTSESKEMLQFKKKIGDTKFKEANDLYNQQVGDAINKIQKDSRFIKLSDDDKKKAISNKKDEIKKNIFIKYHFFPTQEVKKPLPKF